MGRGAQAYEDSPGQTIRGTATSGDVRGRITKVAFQFAARRDASLPDTLETLAARADLVEGKYRKKGGVGGFRWENFLSAGAKGDTLAKYEKVTSKEDKHRRAALGGDWVFSNGTNLRIAR